jgi:hypothetical protein
MLARLQTAQSNVELALGQATGRAAQSLAGIAAHLASAESTLAQSLQSGGPLATLDLGAIERLIQTSETNAQAAVAAGAAEAAAASSAQALAATTAATRTEVRGLAQDLYDRHIFDRDLKFASAADEAAYHADEIKRQQEIAADLAQHTPEGTLNAGGLEAGQMLAAASHGATASPEFLPRWNKLVAQLHQQRETMVADGKSTAQFDRQTREEIRTLLQGRGIPADQIARVLASNDPLQAVTPYLSQGSEHELEAALKQGAAVRLETPPAATDSPSRQTSKPLSSSEIADLGNLAQAGIALSSAGVQTVPANTDARSPLPQLAPTAAARPAGRTVAG